MMNDVKKLSSNVMDIDEYVVDISKNEGLAGRSSRN